MSAAVPNRPARGGQVNVPLKALVMSVLAAAAALSSATARADDDGQADRAAPLLPRYVQECGACHVPYPPAMLPAASWQRLMAGLPRHFGTDASLDTAAAAPIGAWLTAHAGGPRRAADSPPEDRITRSVWFTREHRKVAAATWRSAAVKSPSNCNACHRQADQGRFDEHDVRIPR